MVRKSEFRRRKYEAAVDPEGVKRRIQALKPMMVDQESRYLAQISLIELKVKAIVEAAGVPSMLVSQYVNFGREMWTKCDSFTGATLQAEAQLLVNKWAGRDLEEQLLVRITELFGVTVALPSLLLADSETGSFVWNTAAYGISEVDISALFTTPLTGTDRRKYAVYLDLTGPGLDAAVWTRCRLRLKVRIDGVNYRTVDKREIFKSDLAAAEEPGLPIDVIGAAQDVQITMQFDVALAADQTIPYHWVRWKLE